jgi:hypothetical protein
LKIVSASLRDRGGDNWRAIRTIDGSIAQIEVNIAQATGQGSGSSRFGLNRRSALATRHMASRLVRIITQSGRYSRIHFV